MFAKRKPNRLDNYDYGKNGAYFITICVKDKLPILSAINGTPEADCLLNPKLTEIGMIAEHGIQSISSCYEIVSVDNYVIMPNHIHLIIRVDNERGRSMLTSTTVSRIIQQFKGYVTKQCGKPIWQKSFYDHVIRDENDYRSKWQYIDENPAKWSEDKLFAQSL